MNKTSFAAITLALFSCACQSPGVDPFDATADARAALRPALEDTPVSHGGIAGGGVADLRSAFGAAIDHRYEPTPSALFEAEAGLGRYSLDAALPIPQIAESGPNRLRFKAGAFFPEGDIEDLDTGYYGELAYAYSVVPALAIEATAGYLDIDGEEMGIQAELWAVPVFVNARVQLDIWILEVAGGAGIGGVYVDYEVAGIGEDDFVGAWDAFLGAEVGLGGFRLGAEAKYLGTEDTKDDFSLEGLAAMVMLSIGW